MFSREGHPQFCRECNDYRVPMVSSWTLGDFYSTMPYRGHLDHDKREVFFVNRNYKSLGATSDQWIKYPFESRGYQFYESIRIPISCLHFLNEYERNLKFFESWTVIHSTDDKVKLGLPEIFQELQKYRNLLAVLSGTSKVP